MTLEQEFKNKVGFDAYENNQMQPKVYNESYVEWLEAKINYTRCCEQLPCKNDVASLVIEEIEKNTNTILEQIKQINKFTVNKKTLENLQKLDRNR